MSKPKWLDSIDEDELGYQIAGDCDDGDKCDCFNCGSLLTWIGGARKQIICRQGDHYLVTDMNAMLKVPLKCAAINMLLTESGFIGEMKDGESFQRYSYNSDAWMPFDTNLTVKVWNDGISQPMDELWDDNRFQKMQILGGRILSRVNDIAVMDPKYLNLFANSAITGATTDSTPFMVRQVIDYNEIGDPVALVMMMTMDLSSLIKEAESLEVALKVMQINRIGD